VIHEAPKASFNAQKQEFEGHIPSIHFENRSNGAKQYHWDFGDGSTSVVAHPDHIYKNKGNYIVAHFSLIDMYLRLNIASYTILKFKTHFFIKYLDFRVGYIF
jgi:hypothetical protein